METIMNIDEAGEIFVGWLENRVLASARGDVISVSDVEPAGRFWLGRLAAEEAVTNSPLGERAERMEPCAIGVRCRTPPSPQVVEVQIRCSLWLRRQPQDWQKRGPIEHRLSVSIVPGVTQRLGRDDLERLFAQAVGGPGFSAELRVEWHQHVNGTWELQLELVNTTPQQIGNSTTIVDTRLYECSLAVSGLATMPFVLASLPDSFRYDRRVDAYGINCAITCEGGVLATADHTSVSRSRPRYWSSAMPQPDLRFAALAQEPFSSLELLGDALAEWGEASWGSNVLDARAL
ncbi:MAG: helicase, partial [Deltaproteobacteria bacterium]|nr:helicase [Deltaproteobacteria bacterium]